MRIKPSGPLLLNRKASINRGLVGLWPFIERGGVKYRDYSGFKADAVVDINTPTSVVRQMGRALDFSVSNSYLVCGNNNPLKMTAGVTLAGWYRHLNSGTDGYICGKIISDFSIGMLVNAGAQTLEFDTKISGSRTILPDRASVAGGLDPLKNTDVFFCCTFDGAVKKIYVNGVLANTETISGTLDTTNDSFAIGARGGDGSSTHANFPIYQIAVWNRPLRVSEIEALNTNAWLFYNKKALVLSKVAAASNVVAGTSVGSASVSGTLTGAGAIAGTSAGSATVSGALTGIGAIAGTSAGSATCSGTLFDSTPAVASTCSGSGTASGTLTGIGAIAGSSSGSATVSGTVSSPTAVVGASSGSSTCSGAISGIGSLAGTSAGFATNIGLLLGIGAIAGLSAGVGSASGRVVDPDAVVTEIAKATISSHNPATAVHSSHSIASISGASKSIASITNGSR